MSGTFKKVRNGVFALSMLGALGFGFTEALAGPAPSDAPPTCSPGQCDRECKARFGSFAAGFCDMGVCSCAV